MLRKIRNIGVAGSGGEVSVTAELGFVLWVSGSGLGLGEGLGLEILTKLLKTCSMASQSFTATSSLTTNTLR